MGVRGVPENGLGGSFLGVQGGSVQGGGLGGGSEGGVDPPPKMAKK